VFIAIVIQHATCVSHTVTCGLSSSTIFSALNSAIFGKKLINRKCLLILSTTFVWNITQSENKRDIITVYRSSGTRSCHILMIHEFSQQTLEKHRNIKFYDNFCGSHVVLCRQTNVTSEQSLFTILPTHTKKNSGFQTPSAWFYTSVYQTSF
jgi:hypothetical protein